MLKMRQGHVRYLNYIIKYGSVEPNALQIQLCYQTSLYSKLLFPPFSRYLCSVRISPAFRKSLNALRVVDSDIFRSFAMVGMDGQQVVFLPARSERYMYTEIARWGRSIRYSSVSLRISCPPFQVGYKAPPHYSVDVFMLVLSGIGVGAGGTLGGIAAPIGIWIIGNVPRIARSNSFFPA